MAFSGSQLQEAKRAYINTEGNAYRNGHTLFCNMVDRNRLEVLWQKRYDAIVRKHLAEKDLIELNTELNKHLFDNACANFVAVDEKYNKFLQTLTG